MWPRRVSGEEWRKFVVDVKITSTDKMNDACKEKDEKYQDWATRETREDKAVIVVNFLATG